MSIQWISPDVQLAMETVRDLHKQKMVKHRKTPDGGDRWAIHINAAILISGAAVNQRNYQEHGFLPVPHEPGWIQMAHPQGVAGLVIRLKAAHNKHRRVS